MLCPSYTLKQIFLINTCLACRFEPGHDVIWNQGTWQCFLFLLDITITIDTKMFVYVAFSFQIQGHKAPGCKQAKSHDEWDCGEMVTNFWGVPATNLRMASRGRKRVRGDAPMVVVLWCLLLLGWLPGLESEKKFSFAFYLCYLW